MGVPPKSRFRKTLRNLLNSQVVLFCAGLASGLIVSLWARHPQAVPVAARSAGQSLSLADNVLVIYSFFEGDEASWGNLEFFVQQGVEADDGAQYVFVLNGLRSLSDPRLPRLPPNARYVLHENECYDWGTYAWVFSTVQDPEEFQCTTHTCSACSRAMVLLQCIYRSGCLCRCYNHKQLCAWPYHYVTCTPLDSAVY